MSMGQFPSGGPGAGAFPPPPPPPGPPHTLEDGFNNPEDLSKPLPTQVVLCLNIVNTITHLFLGATACCAFLIAITFQVFFRFSAHIYLCTSGYIILMSLAVLTLSPYSGWTSAINYSNRKAIHWVMQILGSTLAIAGSVISILDASEHLASTHGILGVVAFLFTVLSLIGGVVNLCISQSSGIATFIKICHSGLGSTTIILGFLTLIFGFDMIDGETSLKTYSIVVSVCALTGVVLSAFITSFRRMCC